MICKDSTKNLGRGTNKRERYLPTIVIFTLDLDQQNDLEVSTF